ncbi:hypothetical protein NPIL_22611 [Nephila pilipes]|uniref:Uncharacterized protein n=1 Tax=Nephila pilipes TaxID=299642 RepID=A0A8X6M8V2_NEPPI|nr:hypothetical protein NPIL_22611 [Nephila pilipes]
MVSLQKIDNSFIYKFSSYSKTVRIVAWILRFINNSRIPRNSRKSGIFDSEEISVAEYAVVRKIQKKSFVNEEDEKLKTLRAFKDKNGIIRLKTKILYGPENVYSRSLARKHCSSFRNCLIFKRFMRLEWKGVIPTAKFPSLE